MSNHRVIFIHPRNLPLLKIKIISNPKNPKNWALKNNKLETCWKTDESIHRSSRDTTTEGETSK